MFVNILPGLAGTAVPAGLAGTACKEEAVRSKSDSWRNSGIGEGLGNSAEILRGGFEKFPFEELATHSHQLSLV